MLMVVQQTRVEFDWRRGGAFCFSPFLTRILLSFPPLLKWLGYMEWYGLVSTSDWLNQNKRHANASAALIEMDLLAGGAAFY